MEASLLAIFPSVVFLDVNTFFVPKGGGIRTYHQQKIAWFEQHPEHTYVLVGPGPRYQTEDLAPNIVYIQLYGLQMTSDPLGYRLLLDLVGLSRLVRKYQPDVLEAGDPWLTGLFCIALKKTRIFKGLLSSFYHSDPIRTYFEPWAHRGRFSLLRRALVALFRPLFFYNQKQYQLTLTASKVMQDYLDQHRVNTAHTPFGAPALFFESIKPYLSPRANVSLIYAGRLDQEKGIETLIEAIPELLAHPQVHLTVVGRGAYDTFFQTYRHPQYTYAGYISERQVYLEELQKHHLMIAPGPFETFALGVLEAMALGLPVVGPDQGGTAELLTQVKTHFLFESENPNDLVQVVYDALKEDLAQISQQHREVSLQYGSWERCFSRMIGVYQEAMS